MTQTPVTQADIDAWEIYGPKIFNCEMTGPEVLARHRQEQRSAEAVAWMYEREGYGRELRIRRADNLLGIGWTETPLYAAPGTTPPASEVDVLTHDHVTRAVMASVMLGRWLSAALDDPNTCNEMKADIREWFSAGEPVSNVFQAIAARTALESRHD